MNRNTLWSILGLRGVPPKLINLMSELHSGTESAVRCGDTISNILPVVAGVCQGCVLAPTPFSACMDWILGRILERSSCGASFAKMTASSVKSRSEMLTFPETLEILLLALEVLNEELEPLGLRVS